MTATAATTASRLPAAVFGRRCALVLGTLVVLGSGPVFAESEDTIPTAETTTRLDAAVPVDAVQPPERALNAKVVGLLAILAGAAQAR